MAPFEPLATTHQRNSVAMAPLGSEPASARPVGDGRPSTVAVTLKVAWAPIADPSAIEVAFMETENPVVPTIGRVTLPRSAPPSTKLKV